MTKIDRDATFALWSMAGDVHGLASALDVIVDDPERQGMQAVINALLKQTKELMDAVDQSFFVAKKKLDAQPPVQRLFME